ncbi:MAG TPA: hypothetical protein VGP92_14675, partial [Acidimicrobiia bacterium]|nr:hypothetical protein [Acidimicrobiia bacterium]
MDTGVGRVLGVTSVAVSATTSRSREMKRVALLTGVLLLASCGGGNGSAKQASPTSGLASTTSASTTATTQ